MTYLVNTNIALTSDFWVPIFSGMIGATLKRLRNGRTQKDQAALVGISAQQLNDLENDRRSPRLSTLTMLAKRYGITLAQLVDPENAKQPPDSLP